jgi:hypothetical protein
VIRERAALKAMVLMSHTNNEWSGYGPLVETEYGWDLVDFYYLSSNDTMGSSDLEPEDTAKAWMLTMEDGYKDVVGLAWIHCHPGMMGAFWSGTDETGIANCLRYGASEQVSVCFSGRQVIARRDTDAKSEDVAASMQFPSFSDDIQRIPKAKRPVVTTARKSHPCHICGDFLTLTCNWCKLPTCVSHVSSLNEHVTCESCAGDIQDTPPFEPDFDAFPSDQTEYGILPGDPVTCMKCASSAEFCVMCDEPVCPTHRYEVGNTRQKNYLCVICREHVYGDTKSPVG